MIITPSDKKVAEFFIKVSDDPQLSKELVTIKQPDKILNFAHEQGFSFTLDELKEGVAKLDSIEARQEAGELTEEQLDSVTGGESYILWYLWEGTKEGVKDVVHSVGDTLVSAGEALKRV